MYFPVTDTLICGILWSRLMAGMGKNPCEWLLNERDVRKTVFSESEMKAILYIDEKETEPDDKLLPWLDIALDYLRNPQGK